MEAHKSRAICQQAVQYWRDFYRTFTSSKGCRGRRGERLGCVDTSLFINREIKARSLDKYRNLPALVAHKRQPVALTNCLLPLNSPAFHFPSPNARTGKHRPHSTRPRERWEWRAKRRKWKPSTTRTNTRCICFSAAAPRARTDVLTSFLT